MSCPPESRRHAAPESAGLEPTARDGREPRQASDGSTPHDSFGRSVRASASVISAPLVQKIKDVLAVAGSRVFRQFVMVAVMAIAARMLGKELLGVWALLYIVMQFGVLVADSGVSTFVVRHRQLSSRMYSTAFFTCLMLAAVVVTVVVGLGLPLTHWLGAADYRLHLVAAALTIIPLTVGGLFQARLRRDRRFGAIFTTDVTGSLVLFGSALVMLQQGFGLWALITSTFAGATTAAGLGAILAERPSRQFHRTDAREILHYSLGLLGFSTVHYWSRNADHVLIGRFLGAAPLGIYSFAYRIMMLPLSQINATAQTVALPYLAPHQDDPQRLRESMRQLLTIVAMMVTLPMTLVWLERETLVRLLLGDTWGEVATLLRILAPLAILQAMVSPMGLCFQVLGKTKRLFVLGLINTAATLLSFAIGLVIGGLEAVVASYAIACVVLLPVTVGDGMRQMKGHLSDWARWCSPFFACVVASGFIRTVLPAGDTVEASIAITVASTCVVTLPVYYLAGRVLLGELRWSPRL